MIKIVVFASGNGSNFQSIIENFKNTEDIKVISLICDRKDAYVIQRAVKNNIPYDYINYKENGKIQAENIILQKLADIQPDLIVLAGFMRIFSPYFISNINVPIVNIHPSLLPNHKGANAIERAFYSNDEYSGITIHYVNEEVDGGEIIYSEQIKVNREQTLEDFKECIHTIERRVYPQVITEICHKIKGEMK